MRTIRLSFLGAIHKIFQLALATTSMPRLSWLVKLYENLTYVCMRPRGYRVKLQRQGYTERRTPDNNTYIHIYIWKNAIEQTSAGLAHTRPNYTQIVYLTAHNVTCNFFLPFLLHIPFWRPMSHIPVKNWELETAQASHLDKTGICHLQTCWEFLWEEGTVHKQCTSLSGRLVFKFL